MSLLFTPWQTRGIEMPNRIVVAPMCQYSAIDGVMQDWHLAHLGQIAVSSPGMLVIEATGVSPAGRITPGCVGLWDDATEAGLARVLRFCRTVGQGRIGIQLQHAGRKASAQRPWDGGKALTGREAWQTVAPSAVPFDADWPVPAALDADGMARIIADFVQAAERAARLGLDMVEIHAAHGYLLHQFLSPLSNRREDAYGGSLENRMRFPLELIAAVRAAWPADRPLWVRISGSDFVPGGWDVAQSCVLAERMAGLGVDAVHVSGGGLSPAQQIDIGPGYQTDMAAEIRRTAGVPVVAVGLITDPVQAETILRTGQADLVGLAREYLRDPHWTWRAAQALGGQAGVPPQYLRAIRF